MYDIELAEEVRRWHGRDARYFRGAWSALKGLIPDFEIAPFRVGAEGPENPHLRTVVRLPITATELPIPVATVSPIYALAKHDAVAQLCIDGLRACEVVEHDLTFELGLSGWLNG